MLQIGLGITRSDWWDKTDTSIQVAIIIGAAICVWILGRLAIRGAIRGIREGAPRSESRMRRLVGRSRTGTATTELADRLETVRRRQRADTIGIALRSILGIAVFVAAVLTILSEFGIPVGSLIAAAGILGVALGFGAQSLVKDVLSGMFILLEDQYGVGDSVDLGEASGAVEQVGLRTTRLRSLNGTVWFVPNGEIRRVGNKSRLWSRAMVEVRVNYSQDVEVARAALLEAATAAMERDEIAKHVLGAPTVPGVESLAADAVVLRVFVQVQPGQQWDVERAIRAEIQRVFRKRGVRLAVPENRVYVDRPADDAPRAPEAATKARRPAPRQRKSP